ncbi:bifunctional hydroxymethylpyrimidine kinase/phosphomethylpyrimidine kinase [Hydrogenophaga taeniospiralis]|jgi:hydroxymethylpyrimidine/phosphomethylpyrimidine kinase|uniref:bifunctional hydroxymethylpyrimidine kinase/phosphomethylpyrimidine kinase n=1 Tax=Hydrogenophaga taeniospiralis TaxID=65656 RepID=UPI0008D512FB|nr:bifunctional hydroxymethylpyrimidine kinase/phosphomethylpyrimidine kinase [Hydrogenophaga taeniospiralis]MCB4363796.1 bifunctional hydroxymethylpyrimidine kinase/phosphomethylpyrimidine kinase [Hydrogenophaga taeniospiralis]OGB16280.1 MAG: hydroxymethylpyrimidine/phosphomethylpyrimidine kinase [Burkholderiales bacterium RIFCSPLOWO2_02_FULL_67_64]OGB44041.1 MAG: hydroxymethylpyrimidine/phosphomethylpyrimidine kinase [Burkholderiales bacterium RIFCSPLOWO2_12_67_14]OGB55223.1 MAG: hydroxymethy
MPDTPDTSTPTSLEALGETSLPCVMVFNANDPSGAGGLSADITAMSSASAHVLPVVTGVYVRDTSEIHDHIALDEEAVTDQARCSLEDVPVQAFKVGFVGSPENLSAIAGITTDYAEVPVVAYMPDLSWWDELAIETYLDACVELLLPQTTVLVGNHSTLCRWLLPEWEGDRPPNAREVARAAAVHGVPYTLVTGFNAADQYLESHLASPETVLASARYERFEATFSGAGDTLSAALCALIAGGADLQAACAEALTYLDQCLDAGFQPGMGHAVPDRLFWAHEDDEEGEGQAGDPSPDSTLDVDDFPLDTTRH